MLNRVLQFVAGAGIVGVVLFAGSYVLESSPIAPACSSPVTYRLGSIDNRFGVSESEFKVLLKEAADVWNTAAGKTIVAYDEEAAMPVSLMYDERQQSAELGNAINSDQAMYESKKAEVDFLIQGHEARVAQHEASLAAFERAQDAYAAEVQSWNQKGGAPAAEYEKLEAKRRSLERQQAEINAEAGRLNRMIADVNSEVQELNVLAARVNVKVDVYNEFAGEEFDQGQYIEDENGTRITIYEFRTREGLVRALAHEFGHALGILHTKDPQSLMYPYNTGKDIELHAEDLEALKAACDFE